MCSPRTAVYSTVYPGVEPFLREWHRSLVDQVDRDFDLWIGSDGLSRDAVDAAVGERTSAKFVLANSAATPASIRRQAMVRIVRDYDIVVFIDSDDVALPDRVARARKATNRDSISACALALIDENGRDLRMVLGEALVENWDAILPRSNVLGLSNSAYGTDLLSQLLDFPDDCQLLDWNLATRAWILGASIRFDRSPLMKYRQYSRNIARVVPPFSSSQVIVGTRMVIRHYEILLRGKADARGARWDALREARDRASAFAGVIENPERLEQYIRALNRLSGPLLWWEWVGQSLLEAEWTS